MKTKKNTNKVRTVLPKTIGDTHGADAIDSKAFRGVIKVDAEVSEDPKAGSFTKHIERQTLRAFLDAVKAWRLNDAESALLIGVEPASVEEWKTGNAPTSEEILARMGMVALIRTALDIVFSSPFSSSWMTSPNSGYPYSGLSPVAYVGKHGWPGLFFVLRQTQGHAVGN